MPYTKKQIKDNKKITVFEKKKVKVMIVEPKYSDEYMKSVRRRIF